MKPKKKRERLMRRITDWEKRVKESRDPRVQPHNHHKPGSVNKC